MLVEIFDIKSHVLPDLLEPLLLLLQVRHHDGPVVLILDLLVSEAVTIFDAFQPQPRLLLEVQKLLLSPPVPLNVCINSLPL